MIITVECSSRFAQLLTNPLIYNVRVTVFMNQWSIQKRLLFITLMPCLITALSLGSYFTWQRMELLSEQSLTQFTLSSQQLALQAPAFFETDHHNNDLQNFLDIPHVRALALLTPQQELLMHVGPNMLAPASKRIIDNQTHRFNTHDSIRLRTPIFASDDNLHTKLLGWIEVEFETHNLEMGQLKSLLSSFVLVSLFCILAIYMALRASLRITRPLQHVALTLEQLEAGNLEARIQLTQNTEFTELSTGINAMATSLQRAQQELQDSVEQATEDLKETLEAMEVQNIELNLARRNALDASNTKSEFLANMSHEIRTPLNGILGFTKLLHKTRMNKRQTDYLQTIESSSSSLLTIINDILDFSKIEAGKLVLDNAPLHLRDITDEVLTLLAPEAHKKGIELAALVYQDVPFEIIGDQMRIKQVLTNLISNAIKFTPSGSVIVRIMLEEEINQKVSLKFTVTDTGIGLSDEQKQHLFKAFRQAEASTSRRFGGTGLGLVISRHLVEHMQGEIGVNSQEGAGSQFWFTGQFEMSSVEAENWTDANWHDKQAYLLSQWDTSSQILQHQLNNLGLNVTTFTNLTDLLERQKIQPAPLCFVEANEPTDYLAMKALEHGTELIVLLPNNDAQYQPALAQLQVPHTLVYPIAHNHLSQLLLDIFHNQTQSSLNFLKQSNQHVRILAVDDNAPNLELLTTWLNDLDVQVIQATGGKQAAELGTQHKFDLIFMDIQMPDLDGIEATKLIRAQSINRQTPLVALTAHALPNERKQLLQSGFDDYLSKPMSEEQLSHTLAKWTQYQPQSFTFQKKIQKEMPSLIASDDKNTVNWAACLTLAGHNTGIAQKMLHGLIIETQQLAPLVASLQADMLLEPIHKLHGLSRYVGAEELRDALHSAETCLKTYSENGSKDWPKQKKNLLSAMEAVINWGKENPWLEKEMEASSEH